MKKLLLITIIVFASFICINELDALSYSWRFEVNDTSLPIGNTIQIQPYNNAEFEYGFALTDTVEIRYALNFQIVLCSTYGGGWDYYKHANLSNVSINYGTCVLPSGENTTQIIVTGTLHYNNLPTGSSSDRGIILYAPNRNYTTTTRLVSIDRTLLTGNEIDTNELVQNQQQTNEKLDNIDNTMKDDDIDTSGANSFFDDFNDIDHGGLSSIITSPLSAFSKITQTCSPIDINVLGKEITLPCGDTLFWNKTNVQTFRTIWNILLGGPILYALLLKLYHIIEGLKNPDDDRIEVAKL